MEILSCRSKAYESPYPLLKHYPVWERGGGGFGRGIGAGILGGLLGGWLGNRLAHRDDSASSDAFAPPVDPSPSTPGGGDNTSPGPDFSGEAPSDFGGGGDFGAEQEGNDDSTDDDGGGDSF
jgi:hypothetical protein